MITLEKARIATRAAQTKAQEIGISITVSIVDQSGRLILTERADGTGFLTPETSKAKAVASAAFKRTTKHIAENAGTGHTFWSIVSSAVTEPLITTPGGVPLTHSNTIIGAIGCAGGTAEQDHECANAGAQALANI